MALRATNLVYPLWVFAPALTGGGLAFLDQLIRFVHSSAAQDSKVATAQLHRNPYPGANIK